MAGWRGRAGALLAGVALLVGGPARAEEPPAPATATTAPATTAPGTTAPAPAPTAPATTLAAAPETKILTIGPATTTATTTTTTPAPAPRPGTPAPAPSVRADSPALRALVEAAGAERRRLADGVAGAEARVAGLEAALDAALGERSAHQARRSALELDVVRGRAGVERAGAVVAALEASAVTAAEAVQADRTPVARPPAPGRTPRDAAAQARRSLDEATAARRDALAALGEAEDRIEAAGAAAAGASAAADARMGELAEAREALEGLRRQLVAAEQSLASIEDAGVVTLVPTPSALAAATIPGGWLPLYARGAATCPGLPWPVLAAVGSVESAHGQSTAPGVRDGENVAGAMGPMQFLAGTWAAYGTDGDDDGVSDVYDPDDAVFGAARYLCASGGGRTETLRAALWAYNHADWYVEMVLELAARY